MTNNYVTCPRCEGKGVIPLSDLHWYEDAPRVRAELWRRLGATTAKSRRAWSSLMVSADRQRALVALLDDPELAAAVERITGVTDLASAHFQRRVRAVQDVLGG